MRPSLLKPLRFYTSQVRENPGGGFSALVYARTETARTSVISARCSFGEYHQVKELGTLHVPCGVSRTRTGDPRYAKPMLYH